MELKGPHRDLRGLKSELGGSKRKQEELQWELDGLQRELGEHQQAVRASEGVGGVPKAPLNSRSYKTVHIFY